MKTLTVILALLASLVPGAPPGEVELFQNPGFEEGLDGWRTLNLSGSCQFQTDKKNKHGGKLGLEIERTAGNRIDFVKQSGELPSDVGKVSLSAWYKVDKEGHLRIDGYFFDAQGETLGAYAPIADSSSTRKKWKQAEETFDVPEGATGFGVNVRCREAGRVWIDDLSALFNGEGGAAAAPMELANGGFEDGLDGWQLLGKETQAEVDRRVHAGGKGALLLEREDPRLFPERGLRTTTLRKARQKSVRLSFVARTEGAARGVVCLQALSESGAVLASLRHEIADTKERFKPDKLELDLPRGAHEVVVVVSIAGRGKVWFDDLELKGR